MLPYFKRYSIYVCVIAAALPLIYSTAYPLLTGTLAASSLSGTVTMFALFVAGLLVGFGIFERKAQAKADALLALYNDDCDPVALIEEGASLAEAIKEPYSQTGAWYMSYYAQAKLDVGDAQDAKDVLASMLEAAAGAKKPLDRAAILVNAVPLIEKLEGNERALEVVQDGLAACEECRGTDAAHYIEFLTVQGSIVSARIDDDAEMLLELDESFWQSGRYPKRIRVEYAWDAASAAWRAQEGERERRALEFVAANGGKLAMTARAKERLAAM